MNYSRIGLVFGWVLLGGVIGCVHAPRQTVVYAPPPPNYVAAGIVVQDNYVYYPGYQVYYNSYRRQYVYQNGPSWVSRPMPPRVSADVLFASPSVKLDFRDSPSIHHATVVRQYPKHWAPPESSPNHGQGNREYIRANDERHR